MNLNDVGFCNERITIYYFPPSKRIFIEHLAKAIAVTDFETFFVVVDIRTPYKNGLTWRKRYFYSNNLFDFVELTQKEYEKEKTVEYDYRLDINKTNNEWVLCYLNKNAKITYVDDAGKLSKNVLCGAGWGSQRFERYLIESGADFEYSGPKFEVETNVVGYYKTLRLENETFNIILQFKTSLRNKLIFSWDKSSKCFVGKFDNGVNLKRLGWLTVSQDAVEALKLFGKEPDGSYGNKTIARRMKKYIYL